VQPRHPRTPGSRGPGGWGRITQGHTPGNTNTGVITTKSCNELLALSLSLGPVPTTSWLAVPCNALPILGTSGTDAIIGRLEDVTGHAADR
jgi:hypothetical protein